MSTAVYVLHVLLAFAAVAFLIVPGVFLEFVAHTHDVPFIRKAYGLMSFHGRIGGPLAFLLLPVGIWLAALYGIPLTAGWLIASYVVYAAIITLGVGYHTRRERTIGMLSAKSSDDAPSPELSAALDDPLAQPMNVASALLWAVIIWLMTARPF
ncbi:MAG TPA: DUF2269 family protein [Candidatus Baltobacteraceae bacterium]|nr:DUF2269 family protein [Candidatus Baltobacteraceae bacterium]